MPFNASVSQLRDAIMVLLMQIGSVDPEIPDTPHSIAGPILALEKLAGKAPALAMGTVRPIVMGQTVASSAVASSMVSDGKISSQEAASLAINGDSQAGPALSSEVIGQVLTEAAKTSEVSLKDYSLLTTAAESAMGDNVVETAADNWQDGWNALKTGGVKAWSKTVGDFFGDIGKGGGLFGKIRGKG